MFQRVWHDVKGTQRHGHLCRCWLCIRGSMLWC